MIKPLGKMSQRSMMDSPKQQPHSKIISYRRKPHRLLYSERRHLLQAEHLKTACDEHREEGTDEQRRHKSVECQTEEVGVVRVCEFPNIFVDNCGDATHRKGNVRTTTDGKIGSRKTLNPRDMFSYVKYIRMPYKKEPLFLDREQQRKKSSVLSRFSPQSHADLQPISLKIFMKMPINKPSLKSPSRAEDGRNRSGTMQYQQIKSYYENKYETKK